MSKEFEAILFSGEEKGAWTFTPVPAEFAPEHPTEGWGRTPVMATVDGKTWKTSVWRSKSGETLSPVPKRIRGEKKDGDLVTVKISQLLT